MQVRACLPESHSICLMMNVLSSLAGLDEPGLVRSVSRLRIAAVACGLHHSLLVTEVTGRRRALSKMFSAAPGGLAARRKRALTSSERRPCLRAPASEVPGSSGHKSKGKEAAPRGDFQPAAKEQSDAVGEVRELVRL